MTGRIAALLLATTMFAAPALAIDPPAKVLEGTAAQSGLIPLHVDRKAGRIIATLPAPIRCSLARNLVTDLAAPHPAAGWW